MIIGLTGQTGAGKSTIGKILSENGFFVVSCDEEAKAVRNDKKIIEQLQNAFGEDIARGGTVDRRLLAERAFKNEESTRKIDSIMHPEILKRCIEKIETAQKNGYEIGVLDAPVLFESGGDRLCDKIICVIAAEETRLERIMKRDNITIENALLRISAQKGQEYYTLRSDYIITNENDSSYMEQTISIINSIKELYSNGL